MCLKGGGGCKEENEGWKEGFMRGGRGVDMCVCVYIYMCMYVCVCGWGGVLLLF